MRDPVLDVGVNGAEDTVKNPAQFDHRLISQFYIVSIVEKADCNQRDIRVVLIDIVHDVAVVFQEHGICILNAGDQIVDQGIQHTGRIGDGDDLVQGFGITVEIAGDHIVVKLVRRSQRGQVQTGYCHSKRIGEQIVGTDVKRNDIRVLDGLFENRPHLRTKRLHQRDLTAAEQIIVSLIVIIQHPPDLVGTESAISQRCEIRTQCICYQRRIDPFDPCKTAHRLLREFTASGGNTVTERYIGMIWCGDGFCQSSGGKQPGQEANGHQHT